MKIIFCLCSLILFTSCNVKKTPIGKYRSNFAEAGFFITEIELKLENRFNYEFSGDMGHQKLEGKYTIENNNLFLKFNRLKNEIVEDAIKINGNDTVVDFVKLFHSQHSFDLKKENEIEYHLKYKILNNKLFSYHFETGKLIIKNANYSRRRKYLIVGTQKYMRKSFLKKITHK
jgi:hypothetical protein